MPHSFGKRNCTRYMFKKDFRTNGQHNSLTKYLHVYRVGDIVDIKADGAIQRGMPHKYYHGRTGRVFTVTKSSLGVEVYKQVRHRILRKRINVRIEHVRPSRSREGFLNRVKENDAKRKAAQEAGVHVILKRIPVQPKGEFTVDTSVAGAPETLYPIPFDYLI